MLVFCCYLGLVSTVYMTGVVWFAQLVHYPLLNRGNPDAFLEFAHEYQRRTLWVVTPGLVGEVGSTVLLVWLWPSPQTWVGLGVLAAIWLSTWAWQIPAHLKLKQGFDAEVHAHLVSRNLPRSLLWTLRSAVMIWTTVTLP